jgi:hypothetical protein
VFCLSSSSSSLLCCSPHRARHRDQSLRHKHSAATLQVACTRCCQAHWLVEAQSDRTPCTRVLYTLQITRHLMWMSQPSLSAEHTTKASTRALLLEGAPNCECAPAAAAAACLALVAAMQGDCAAKCLALFGDIVSVTCLRSCSARMTVTITLAHASLHSHQASLVGTG